MTAKGSTLSPETRRKISDSKRGVKTGPPSAETRQKISEALLASKKKAEVSALRRGKCWNEDAEADGWYLNRAGYCYLTGQQEHPLAIRGAVAEHRKVLYDKIGPGPHPCHWCRKMLYWGGHDGICVDHLDDDKSNNDPENLVPSCSPCNSLRGGVVPPRGEKNGQAKLTEAEVLQIRRYPRSVSHRALAIVFGVSPQTVGKIRRGERWKHL